MKNCPKCNNSHSKPGKFCSRKCANSRIFSEETNRKRAKSNKISGINFWKNSDRANEIRNERALKKKIPETQCKTCGKVFNGTNKFCSVECKNPIRKPKHNRKLLLGNVPLPALPTPQFGIRGKASSLEKEIARREKIKASAKLKNGGYRKGSGRGKKGWYKGIFCDSSWELAYLLYCEFHSIVVERNTKTFEYYYENKKYKYLPDFLVMGQLVEIKGYLSEKNLAKISQCPEKIEVLDYEK